MILPLEAQIVNALAGTNHRRGLNDHEVDAYGRIVAVAAMITALGIAVTAALGPEKRGKTVSPRASSRYRCCAAYQ